MPEAPSYIVSAKVLSFWQANLSKAKGKILMYSYFDLQILEGVRKDEPSATLSPDTCHITRRELPGDTDIKVGDLLKLELAFGSMDKPLYATWVKRIPE